MGNYRAEWVVGWGVGEGGGGVEECTCDNQRREVFEQGAHSVC